MNNKNAGIYSNIIDTIADLEDIQDSKDIFWKSFMDSKLTPKHKKLKILLLSNPCNGFGDCVFAMKIFNYLKEWYKADVDIASTETPSFNKLGISDNLIKLSTKNKNSQCRRFQYVTIPKNLPKYDLLFVAPLQSDYFPNLQDVRYLIPYANKFNTFFFSEYNHDDDDLFDFPTGVGDDNMGLLFTNPKKIKRLEKLKNPYAVVYVTDNDPHLVRCFISFLEMVCKKYKNKYKKLDIVIPSNISFILEDQANKIRKDLGKYYRTIEYKGKDEEYTILDEGGNTLTFRADIFPVQYFDMVGIIENSIKDILLTGDQSITDALSCCSDKNIFYQTLGWKETFAEQLAKKMPNKYLLDTKTSCGTLKAIKYRSNYKHFVHDWDFRKLAKPKLDAVVKAAEFKKDNKKIVEDIEDMIIGSKTVPTLQTKIMKYFNVE